MDSTRQSTGGAGALEANGTAGSTAGSAAGSAIDLSGAPRRRRAPARRSPGRYPTLAQAFDPRRNSLNVLRLVLAAVVALVHATQNGYGHQPHVGVTEVGALAVEAFFVISGFLVTRSLLRLGSVRRYAWHRFLRIMPGFWVCLLVTALLVAPAAAWLSGRPASSVFTGPESSWSYLSSNAALFMGQFGIGGLTDPVDGGPAVVDGSLWTLFYEACCYVAVAVLGLVGVLRRRPWLLLAGCALLWVATIAAAAGLELGTELMLRFLFVFLLGAAGYVFAERVPVSGALAGACAVLVLTALHLLPDYRALAGPAFAYVLLWAVVRLPLRWNPRWDLSYGLYIYHWPIQLLLVLAGARALGTAPFVALSLLLACTTAAASWLLVEAPALRLKDGAWVQAAPFTRRAHHRISG